MNVFQIVIPGTSPYGFRLSGGDGEAVYVARVRSESKAEQAGLKENDVVIAINGILCFDLTYNSVFGLTELQDHITLHLLRGEQAQRSWRKASEELVGQLLKLNESEVVSQLRKKSGNTFAANEFFMKPQFELSVPVPKVRTFSNPTVNFGISQTSTASYMEPIIRSPSSVTMTLVSPYSTEQQKTVYNTPISFSSHAIKNSIEISPKFTSEANRISICQSQTQYKGFQPMKDLEPNKNWGLNSLDNRLRSTTVNFKTSCYEPAVLYGNENIFEKEDYDFLKQTTAPKSVISKTEKTPFNEIANTSTRFENYSYNYEPPLGKVNSNNIEVAKNNFDYNFIKNGYNHKLDSSFQMNTNLSEDRFNTATFFKPANILKLYNVGNLHNASEPAVDKPSKSLDSSNYNENDSLLKNRDKQISDETIPIYSAPPPPAPPIPIQGIPMIKSNTPSNAYSLLSEFENTKDEEKTTMSNKVQMAKSIALSVLSPDNKNSKGQKMFLRRREMSENWTVSSKPDETIQTRSKEASSNVFNQLNRPWIKDDYDATNERRNLTKLNNAGNNLHYATLPRSNFNVPNPKNVGETPLTHFKGYRPISFSNYDNTLSLGYCDL